MHLTKSQLTRCTLQNLPQSLQHTQLAYLALQPVQLNHQHQQQLQEDLLELGEERQVNTMTTSNPYKPQQWSELIGSLPYS